MKKLGLAAGLAAAVVLGQAFAGEPVPGLMTVGFVKTSFGGPTSARFSGGIHAFHANQVNAGAVAASTVPLAAFTVDDQGAALVTLSGLPLAYRASALSTAEQGDGSAKPQSSWIGEHWGVVGLSVIGAVAIAVAANDGDGSNTVTADGPQAQVTGAGPDGAGCVNDLCAVRTGP